MGIFFEPTGEQQAMLSVEKVTPIIERTLKQEPPAAAEMARALDAAVAEVNEAATAPAATGPGEFQGKRFVLAAAVVLVLVAAGIFCEANGWGDSSKSIWALATTGFGVIVGLLGGEAKSK